jgi:translation initiation factor 1 (eIF-1/SUI1)
MQIREITDNLTGRVDLLEFQPQKFMDQKILKGLSRVFSCGGTIHIESDDGYEGTIHLPGPAEEEE